MSDARKRDAINDLSAKYLAEEGQDQIYEYLLHDEVEKAQEFLLGVIDALLSKREITDAEALEAYELLGIDPEDASRLRQQNEETHAGFERREAGSAAVDKEELATEEEVRMVREDPLTLLLTLPDSRTLGRWEAAEMFAELAARLRKEYPNRSFTLLPFSFKSLSDGSDPALDAILAIAL